MKQKLLFICLTILCALAWSGEAWGATGYVLRATSEVSKTPTSFSGTDFDYDDFTGPGLTLSFKIHRTVGYTALGTGIWAGMQVHCYINNNWEEYDLNIDKPGKNYGNDITFDIPAGTTKIRLHLNVGCTLAYYIKDVLVTRATTLGLNPSTYTSPATSLDYGTFHRINNNGTSKTLYAKVDYNNTTYNQTLTGSGPTSAYSVTPTTMEETSYTGKGSSLASTNPKSIPIKFSVTNLTALGSHSGNAMVSMNGVSTTVAVSANVVTTYYGKAIATASTGGSAYVSFTSYDAATSTSATTNTANTSNASESKTAYYKATVNTGYVFLGWIKGTAAYSANNVVSTSLTYNPSITYSSETSGSPTETTYKAWFAPMFYFSANAISSNESLGTASASITTEVQGNPDETTKTATATFTATKKEGCTFNGWYETSDYSGTPVSTSTTYTRNLTDNNVSSIEPVSLTLYAWFKKNPNLQWADPSLDLNLVVGATGSSAATAVDEGITINYSSSKPDILSIDTNGDIEAKKTGQSTVTASVSSTFTYNAETITREFTVGEKLQATFTPAWGEDSSTDIKVGSSTTIALTNVATDATFTISASPTGIVSWSRSGNTLTINGDVAGTTTLTLLQTGNTFLNGNTANYEITVSRYANTFALAAETKDMKVGDKWENVITNNGNNNTQVTYSVANIATYDATNNRITADGAGSTAITFIQAATADHEGITKTVNVNVTKVTNTLAIALPTQEADVGGTIALSISGKNNSANIVATITDPKLSTSVNNGTNVITFDPATNKITACNAGTAKIKFSQPATTQYTAYESDTYEITVRKKTNSITITNLGGGTATNIKLKYNATAALAYTSTNTETSPVVTRISGSYTTYANNNITAGSSPGTDIYEIRQAETYEYAAGYTSFTVRVNNTDEVDGYVLYEEAEESHTPISTEGTYFNEHTLNGPGEILSFKAHNSWFIGNGITKLEVQCYVNGSWQTGENAAKYIDNLSTSYGGDITCEIPEGTTKIRFFLRVGSTLEHCIKDVKVTRKTYVSATSNTTNLGTCYTDQTASATFTVNYSSTNGGNINIQSNNSHFVPSISSISVETNKTATSSGGTTYICGVDGTQTFTVTYTPDPDDLGEESATITIGDLFYSQQITLTATSRKYDTSIARGSNTATATTVDGSISGNVFAFSGTSTATPSANSSDDFYYAISHTQTSNVNNGEGVISYDPATNTITGLNAGTARLTIYQKKTLKYHATSQSFDFSVTKLANNLEIALSATELDVDGTTTVLLTDDDSDGALSVTYSNISYLNESQNRDGGLLLFDTDTKTLTGVNAGTGKVTVTQAETYKYVSKSQEFTVTVNKLSQTLSWDDPDLETSMQKGTTLSGNTATSSVGLTPVTYSSSNTAAITVDASTGELTAVETGSNITITASQSGNYKYNSATLTRQFSVFNKQVPIFSPDEHFTDIIGKIEYTGTATITVTGVSTGDDFSITNENNSIINVVQSGETITITGLAVGNTTLTLTQEGNDNFIGKSQTYNIEVYMPDDFLMLSPASAPSYDEGDYRKIFLNRTLKAGYSTIALPFDTDVATLTGRAVNDDDWVAQLDIVTYSVADGFTLYFQKVDGGTITANQPYVLHLGYEVKDPTWTDTTNGITVATASAASVTPSTGYSGYAGWTMNANYEVGFNMNGKYGIVNNSQLTGTDKTTYPDGGLMLGSGEDAKLNAFTAYITGPTSGPNGAPKLRVAYVDEDGTATFIGSLPEDDLQGEPVAIYGPDGQRRSKMQRGVNIVRYSDGTTRKINY